MIWCHRSRLISSSVSSGAVTGFCWCWINATMSRPASWHRRPNMVRRRTSASWRARHAAWSAPPGARRGWLGWGVRAWAPRGQGGSDGRTGGGGRRPDRGVHDGVAGRHGAGAPGAKPAAAVPRLHRHHRALRGRVRRGAALHGRAPVRPRGVLRRRSLQGARRPRHETGSRAVRWIERLVDVTVDCRRN